MYFPINCKQIINTKHINIFIFYFKQHKTYFDLKSFIYIYIYIKLLKSVEVLIIV